MKACLIQHSIMLSFFLKLCYLRNIKKSLSSSSPHPYLCQDSFLKSDNQLRWYLFHRTPVVLLPTWQTNSCIGTYIADQQLYQHLIFIYQLLVEVLPVLEIPIQETTRCVNTQLPQVVIIQGCGTTIFASTKIPDHHRGT